MAGFEDLKIPSGFIPTLPALKGMLPHNDYRAITLLNLGMRVESISPEQMSKDRTKLVHQGLKFFNFDTQAKLHRLLTVDDPALLLERYRPGQLHTLISGLEGLCNKHITEASLGATLKVARTGLLNLAGQFLPNTYIVADIILSQETLKALYQPGIQDLKLMLPAETLEQQERLSLMKRARAAYARAQAKNLGDDQ